MQAKRFHGKAGEEYELFKLACPHYDELQGTVRNILRYTYQGSDQAIISVLEIGCGPGYTTDMILAANPRIKVTAVDNETVMIEQAKESLSDYISDGRMTLVKEDGLKYLKSLPDNSVDAFVSGFTLHNFKQEYRTEVVREIHRVLKKGGLFLNADKYVQDDEEEHKRELDWQLKQFEEKYAEIGRPDLKEEWTKHYLEDNDPAFIMRESEAIQQLQAAGFVDVEKRYRQHMEAVIVAKK